MRSISADDRAFPVSTPPSPINSILDTTKHRRANAIRELRAARFCPHETPSGTSSTSGFIPSLALIHTLTDKQPLGKRISGVSLIFAVKSTLCERSAHSVNDRLTKNLVLKRVYGDEVTNNINHPIIVSSMLFAGTVVGMPIFGYLSDKMGRKFGMMTATGSVAFFSLLSAASEAFVPLVLYWIFGPNHLRAVWRMSLGLGFIPAMLVFLWRLNMDEPESYKKSSMKSVKIPYMLVLRRYWASIVAISATWFIYDFITFIIGGAFVVSFVAAAIESDAFDDDVGSQQFLEKLSTLRGLDPLLPHLDDELEDDDPPSLSQRRMGSRVSPKIAKRFAH
ncbi:hypothetical protein C8R42DRAFT_645639 [Lentinula raphanica]|nr:hypothetical protein C8R42DRAFT_645639 [Lentinula raphanica]